VTESDIETDLVDLRDMTLEQIRSKDVETQKAVEELLRQVERPRINLGVSGPPGRAD
jgi:hypothetical protein